MKKMKKTTKKKKKRQRKMMTKKKGKETEKDWKAGDEEHCHIVVGTLLKGKGVACKAVVDEHEENAGCNVCHAHVKIRAS